MGILEMTNCEEGMKIRMISDEKKCETSRD